MVDIVLTILRRGDRFLLAQKSAFGSTSGAWVFPGGEVDPEDKTFVDTANRWLKEEVGLEKGQFVKLCDTCTGGYHVQIFCCHQWSGEPKPSCKDVIGVGWFTLAEMHALINSLAPFINDNLMYISYWIQNYDSPLDEWHRKWRRRDENS